MRLERMASLVCVVMIAACHRGGSQDVSVSCDKRESLSECTEYTSELPTSRRKFLDKSCKVAHGSFREGTCSHEEAVGHCELAGERSWMFSDGATPFTAETARKRCDVIEGTWSAGN